MAGFSDQGDMSIIPSQFTIGDEPLRHPYVAQTCRSIPLSMTFAGSDESGRRAAEIYALIAVVKLNDVDSLASVADLLGPPAGPAARRIQELLS